MKKPIHSLVLSRWPLIVVLAVTGVAVGQSGGGFELERARIDAGAASATGGPYTLNGLAGQAEAARAARGAREGFGGFHAPDSTDHIFADSYE